MILGIDPSTFLEQQRIAQSVYTKRGKKVDPFFEFKKNGGTHIRIRIWNDPYDKNRKPYLAGTCDLDNFINLCKKLKKYNFKYVVDFHYSDFWADPSKQYLPKAWENKSLKEVEKLLYEFTKDSLLRIKKENIDVDYIQPGNEITQGLCWPLAKRDKEDDSSFDNIAILLKSGIKACKEVFPEAKIILHLEQSYDQPLYRRYLSNLIKRDVKFDIVGTSYYPFWHHSFEEYFANMDMVQKEFGLPVMNVELGFAFTLEDYKADENGVKKHLVINADNIEDFKKMMPFDCTPKGQKQFVKEFLKLAKKHHLLGVFYWEPFWIPGEGICWASDEGQIYNHSNAKDTRNEWANQCLFDYSGEMLPAFSEFKQ